MFIFLGANFYLKSLGILVVCGQFVNLGNRLLEFEFFNLHVIHAILLLYCSSNRQILKVINIVL